MDYKLRFTASEWARIEHELTRERGLWGPEEPSTLDKWMLDFVEGTRYIITIGVPVVSAPLCCD